MGKDIAVVAVDLEASATSGVVVVEEAVGEAAGPDESGAAAGTGVVRRGQRGMVSAEWAVGIVAAVAIAGVLLAVITSGQVQEALLKFLLWVIKQFIEVVN